MDKILDREEQKKEQNFWKNSWFVVLAANGILVLISSSKTYSFFHTLSVIGHDYPVLIQLHFFINTLSFFMLICNFVLCFFSLLFSPVFWKKWIVMVLIGLVLYGISKATYSFFNIDKLITPFL